MLLRRITKHVTDHNWVAIFIDFLIVVLGILLAFQITNWNETKISKTRSSLYLERIASDLAEEISIYDDRIQFWRQVSNNGLAVLDGTTGNQPLNAWELLLAYFQASQVAEFFPANSTFEELKSAGELSLIRDDHLLGELSAYYAYPGYETLRERPSYREHIRSIVPVRIQIYIWSNCYHTDGAFQKLKTCPSPSEEFEIQQTIDKLQASEDILDELRYWVSSLEVASLIVQSNRETAKKLHNELLIQLGQ